MNIRERLNEIRAHLDAIERELVVGLPWHEAPTWAMWAAMDKPPHGWYWFEIEPVRAVDGWSPGPAFSVHFDAPACEDWTKSKQRRPE